MVVKHIVCERIPLVSEPQDATELTNSEKIEAYYDYLDGVDGTEPSEGTVYRTAAVVPVDPCGACVHDVTKPNERTGYPDPTSPMMMCCGVCGAQWIDPTLERQARTAQRRLDEVLKHAEMMQSMADRLIEESFRTKRSLRVQIVCAVIAGTLLADRIIRILFP